MASLTPAEDKMLIRPGSGTPNMLAADMTLAKDVGDTLYKHYPGWMWVIEIPPKNGVVIIRNLDCNPNGKFGFVLHRKTVEGPQLAGYVMRAGGEFLERHRMPRSKWQPGII